ncbi:hypothetical protein [Bacillus xiapuensis]|uniref:Uncharacterized protein n=1 Tax=Bacillus xiapuensis TaxID=2014075 RepID=A0ABU6NDS7_9BACI|nr:hypothetical protein [Bacillus xiapuensis]
MIQDNDEVSTKKLLVDLELLKINRENQLNKEAYQSYNYGYVAGEISGINKAIALLNNNDFGTTD